MMMDELEGHVKRGFAPSLEMRHFPIGNQMHLHGPRSPQSAVVRENLNCGSTAIIMKMMMMTILIPAPFEYDNVIYQQAQSMSFMTS